MLLFLQCSEQVFPAIFAIFSAVVYYVALHVTVLTDSITDQQPACVTKYYYLNFNYRGSLNIYVSQEYKHIFRRGQ